MLKHLDDVEEDLFVHGFDTTYTEWVHHGENICESTNRENEDDFDMVDDEVEDFDAMQDILKDLHA